jgi:hypothetical protein
MEVGGRTKKTPETGRHSEHYSVSLPAVCADDGGCSQGGEGGGAARHSPARTPLYQSHPWPFPLGTTLAPFLI